MGRDECFVLIPFRSAWINGIIDNLARVNDIEYQCLEKPMLWLHHTPLACTTQHNASIKQLSIAAPVCGHSTLYEHCMDRNSRQCFRLHTLHNAHVSSCPRDSRMIECGKQCRIDSHRLIDGEPVFVGWIFVFIIDTNVSRFVTFRRALTTQRAVSGYHIKKSQHP